ncbi:hypothetical protein H5410_064712 [Solanum commersonii]|uniref:Uncharacterized protein n=1 Tax=Solanum commersonii TaxID=4109 RepID=A0A9J5VYK7_SOLCO|nr:hypothetical protein H5410_064712 [Solanum commersonii]
MANKNWEINYWSIKLMKTPSGHNESRMVHLQVKYVRVEFDLDKIPSTCYDPIYPVPAEEFWNLPPEILERVIPPPEKKTKLGRKRLKQVPTIGEVVSKKRNKCSLCKRFGHKKTSCPTRSNEVAGTSNGVVS